jgi:hypothetical protein
VSRQLFNTNSYRVISWKKRSENRKVGGSTPPLATRNPLQRNGFQCRIFLLNQQAIQICPVLCPFTHAQSVDN